MTEFFFHLTLAVAVERACRLIDTVAALAWRRLAGEDDAP